ncbi:MAG: zinc-ribbon domain-containing protein [Candidatus Lokiarchaeota archaeon]|nr:zinc-ribbon domain-containing protein [Candidatus Lokiarchaeota archaeon]
MAIKYEHNYQEKVTKIFGDRFKLRKKKLCPKCGCEIKNLGDNFCTECGFKLKK